MQRYLANGGRVLACGPSNLPECKNQWDLPACPDLASPEEFFDTISNGVSIRHADWKTKTTVAPSEEPCKWQEVTSGLAYNPHRVSNGALDESLVSRVRDIVTTAPVEILSSRGYLITMFETEKDILVHFLAKDYDTDIDHQLDDMRFHRSRVNYINKVEPIGIDRLVELRSTAPVTIYTPFNEEETDVQSAGDTYRITLPPKTAYAIMKFSK